MTAERRFRRIDALVVTGALALGLCVCHLKFGGIAALSGLFAPHETLQRLLLFHWMLRTVTLCLTWSIALLTLSDAIPVSTAARAPGKLNALLVSVASIAHIPMNWDDMLTPQTSLIGGLFWLPFDVVSNPSAIALVVVSGWLALRMNGVPSPKTDWLNAAGTIVGFVWVCLALLKPLFYLWFVSTSNATLA